MANFWCGNFTASSTGSIGFTGVGFKPAFIIFEVAKKGSTDNTVNYSSGVTDGTRQSTRSIYYDGTLAKTEKTNTNTKCISHLGKPSTTVVPVLQAGFVSFDVDGFTLNFDAVPATPSDYQFNVKCFA